MMLVDNIRSF